MVLWYMFSVWSGSSVERASDIYEPKAALWCLAAIAGNLFSQLVVGTADAPGARATSRRTLPSSAYLAGLTGASFFRTPCSST